MMNNSGHAPWDYLTYRIQALERDLANSMTSERGLRAEVAETRDELRDANKALEHERGITILIKAKEYMDEPDLDATIAAQRVVVRSLSEEVAEKDTEIEKLREDVDHLVRKTVKQADEIVGLRTALVSKGIELAETQRNLMTARKLADIPKPVYSNPPVCSTCFCKGDAFDMHGARIYGLNVDDFRDIGTAAMKHGVAPSSLVNALEAWLDCANQRIKRLTGEQ